MKPKVRNTPIRSVALRDFVESSSFYLFADIRGFTAWSHKHQSEVKHLTKVLYTVAVEVFGHRKSSQLKQRVVKFLGDGFFAVSEYDDERPDGFYDRLHGMILAVLQFDDTFREVIQDSLLHDRSDLGVGYGLAFGPSFRFFTPGQPLDYIGSKVNLAARLCAIAGRSELICERDIRDHLHRLPPELTGWFPQETATADVKTFGNTEVWRLPLQSGKRKTWRNLVTMFEVTRRGLKRAFEDAE